MTDELRQQYRELWLRFFVAALAGTAAMHAQALAVENAATVADQALDVCLDRFEEFPR